MRKIHASSNSIVLPGSFLDLVLKDTLGAVSYFLFLGLYTREIKDDKVKEQIKV